MLKKKVPRSVKAEKGKRLLKVVKNEDAEESELSGYPSLSLPASSFAFKQRQDSGISKRAGILYDKYYAPKRLAQFGKDHEQLEQVSDTLKSLLLSSFHVSNLSKIRIILDKVKENGGHSPVTLASGSAPVFTPDDILFVEQTLDSYDNAQREMTQLDIVEQEFRSSVKGRGGTDSQYDKMYNFITGIHRSHFSKTSLQKQLKSFEDRFKDYTKANHNVTSMVGNTDRAFVERLLNQKLKVSHEDTTVDRTAKLKLGKAAVRLRFYANKGVDTSSLLEPFFDSCPTGELRDALRGLYGSISSFFDLSDSPKEAADAAKKFLFGDTIDVGALRANPDLHPGQIYYASDSWAGRRVLARYATQLLEMAENSKNFEKLCQDAKAEYDSALGELETLPLSDEDKAYFKALPDELFSEEYQQKISDRNQNDVRLKKLLFRYKRNLQLNRGGEGGLLAAIAGEILAAIGVVHNPRYDGDPAMAESARSILAANPDLVRSALSSYYDTYSKKVDAGGVNVEEDIHRRDLIDKFLKVDDYVTRDEFLSGDPDYQALAAQRLALISGYDPDKGYTPEQMEIVGLAGPGVGKGGSRVNYHNSYFAARAKNKAVKERLAKLGAGNYAAIVPTADELATIAENQFSDLVEKADFDGKYGDRYLGLDSYGYQFDPFFLRNFEKSMGSGGQRSSLAYMQDLSSVAAEFRSRHIPEKALLVLSYSPSAPSYESIQVPSEEPSIWSFDDEFTKWEMPSVGGSAALDAVLGQVQ